MKAKMLLMALSVFGALVPAIGLADERPKRAPRVAGLRAGPTILYFAPATERNLEIDEGILQLRRRGFAVTYVTERTSFEKSLRGSEWDLVLTVDVDPFASDAYIEYLSGANWVLDVRTAGEASTHLQDLTAFAPSGVPEPRGPESMYAQDQTDYRGGATRETPGPPTHLPPIGCWIEWIECRLWCIWNTPPGTQERRDCDRECNEALADCERGFEEVNP